MNPRLQHKFGNLTLFSPRTCSDDIKWAAFPTISRPRNNDSDQLAHLHRLIRVIALR